MGRERRASSWAESAAVVDERRADANQLVGLALASVSYVNIDYRRQDFAPTVKGPRSVTAPAEWREPTWRHPRCDSVDFGVELVTTAQRTFAIAWSPPGDHEGLGIWASSLAGTGLGLDDDVAVWDVGGISGWPSLVHRRVSAVDLHYVPWADDGYWCPRITISFPLAPPFAWRPFRGMNHGMTSPPDPASKAAIPCGRWCPREDSNLRARFGNRISGVPAGPTQSQPVAPVRIAGLAILAESHPDAPDRTTSWDEMWDGPGADPAGGDVSNDPHAQEKRVGAAGRDNG